MAKKPAWLWPLLFLVVVAPGFLVWRLFPDVAASTEEGRERQLLTIFAITGLPLVLTLLGLILRRWTRLCPAPASG